ncbi:MAG: dihydrolipoyl dehydrogenase [Coxiellaceae bacterium]|nr:dihydrolipoyl dehydrogenase [Coxiellaceae bacterium]
MEKHVDVAIIGAGSAGLSALKEVRKKTDNVVVIDGGALGTTCAHVGCMPSKALIQVAHDFHRRAVFPEMGIEGGENLTLDIPKALQHVRKLRDRFWLSIVKDTEALGDILIRETAQFIEPNVLQTGPHRIIADKIIIATGSRVVIPDAWSNFADQLITSDNIFEQKNLAKEMAVIGAGVIGLELGQSISRFGIKTSVFHGNDNIGGLTDPRVNELAIDIMRKEMDIHLNVRADVSHDGNQFEVKTADDATTVLGVLAAMGRRPNIDQLGLADIGVELNERGMPAIDPVTLKVDGHSIYMTVCGDTNIMHPLLHEASDDGRIAGYNAVHDAVHFHRRTPIAVVFSDPNIFMAGKRFSELAPDSFVVGEIDFSNQGRSRMMMANQGLMRIYADKKTAHILGVEGIAPAGEHMAHLLAWAIQQNLCVFRLLQMPFYHPVVEEGMRTALRQLAKQLSPTCSHSELAMCESLAADCLS